MLLFKFKKFQIKPIKASNKAKKKRAIKTFKLLKSLTYLKINKTKLRIGGTILNKDLELNFETVSAFSDILLLIC